MSALAVVHLVRAGNGIDPLRAFLQSYLQNPAGIEHDLVVVLKGFSDDSAELVEVRKQLAPVEHSEFRVEDIGYDITAYLAVSRALEYEYYCFVNSYSVILAPGWLEKLYAHITKPGIGLVGATGSRQSQDSVRIYNQVQRRPHRFGPVLGRLFRADQRMQTAIDDSGRDYVGHFDPFPNDHVRTNTFIISRETISRLQADDILTKMDTYWFESGVDGLTKQVLGMGLGLVLVGRDGRGYPQSEWQEADTFCVGNMDNLLVSDNQTRDFAEGDAERKDLLFRHTWIDPMEWHALGDPDPKIRCKNCNWRKVRRKLRARDLNREIGTERFDYYRCRRCGYVYLHPLPESLGDYYAGGYYIFPDDLDAWLPAAEQHEGYKIEILDRFSSGKRLLEIGPSIGGALYLAKRAGYEVDGIEMDAECCAYMRDRLGIDVTRSDDARTVLSETDQDYDVIMSWHVIEHLPDYHAVLRAAADRLAPGGILVLAAPNPDSLQFKLFRRYWAHLDAPRHVALVPPNLLKLQMMGQGLGLEWQTTCDAGGRGWNRFGWENSWRLVLSRFFGAGVAQKLGGPLARLSEVLAWPIEVMMDRGSAYTLVFRRRP